MVADEDGEISVQQDVSGSIEHLQSGKSLGTGGGGNTFENMANREARR